MALTLDITVRPQSGRTRCSLDAHGRIKCELKSAPEKGRANAELIAFIAKALKVSKKQVVVVLGKTSRQKRIRIDHDISQEVFLAMLGIERQQSIV